MTALDIGMVDLTTVFRDPRFSVMGVGSFSEFIVKGAAHTIVDYLPW